jgi:hypothetical protein
VIYIFRFKRYLWNMRGVVAETDCTERNGSKMICLKLTNRGQRICGNSFSECRDGGQLVGASEEKLQILRELLISENSTGLERDRHFVEMLQVVKICG